MSTKIFHGYRLPTVRTLGQLQAFMDTLRATLAPIASELVMRAVAEYAAALVDQRRLGLEPLPDDPHAWAFPLLHAELAVQEGYTRTQLPGGSMSHRAEDGRACRVSLDPDVLSDRDFQCTVVFLLGRGCAHALLYADQPRYREAWAALPEVAEYGYWDNTDRPAEVSVRAWHRRRDTWQQLLGWDAPSTRGLTWHLLGDRLHTLHRPEALLRALPSPDERLGALVRVVAHRRVPPSERPKTFGDLLAYERSDACRTLRAAVRAELAPQFEPRITVDDLLATGDTPAGSPDAP